MKLNLILVSLAMLALSSCGNCGCCNESTETKAKTESSCCGGGEKSCADEKAATENTEVKTYSGNFEDCK